MAKRKGKSSPKRGAARRKPAVSKRSAKRPIKKIAKKSARKNAKTARKAAPKARAAAPRRRPVEEVVPTPPSSLNMNRRGSAARSGRAEMAVERERRRNLSPELAGGDQDADLESAYFTGDETAGGDNPTPDQDIVDDIGRAVGVEYQDNEELGTTDKVSQRDKHRWELDPASAEDYKDRS
jgi:hypothetical protein